MDLYSFFNNKQVHIIQEGIIYLYKAQDIANLLKVSNVRTAFKKNDIDKCIRKTSTNGGLQDVTFLTEKGVIKLICNSRKPEAVKLAEELGFDTNHKFVHSETSFVINIKKAFHGEEIIEQFSVNKYKIDLYIPKHNLAIEFDEQQHQRKKHIINDTTRQNIIEKKLNCHFIRIKDTDDIFDSINKIYLYLSYKIT